MSPPAGPPAAVPAPAASPSPGGRSAMADEASTLSLKGSATAPSGLVATVAEEYDSYDNFCWDSDESGVAFSVSSALTKSNNDVAFYYPSCKHAVVESLPPPLAPPPLRCANRPINLPVASSSKCIVISKHLMSIIALMSAALILPMLGLYLTMADSGATDHMFPDKSAFISYRLVTNLQVRMGNNSFLPVLGRGLAIISLNGQHILVRNALHVPGLVIPSTAYVATLRNPAVTLLVRPVLVSWSDSLPLFCPSTPRRIAIWPSSLWGAPLPSILYITSSLAALRHFTLWNLPFTQPPSPQQ